MLRSLAVVLVSVLLLSCAGTEEQSPQLVVAPLGSNAATTSGMTRAELEDHVRRFADRYFTRVTIAANELAESSSEHMRLMHNWKTVSQTAIVDIAIGPNAVTNLLDMMTVTRLSRLVVENHWVPEVFGEELGLPFLRAYIDLENDIWTVADDVLTQRQQAELQALVDDWHAENPGQYYPWYVRMGNFSGQRAASLAAVQQSGGMLREVARAREAAEEIQAFGERVLFYLQRAPMITSNEFESGVSSMLQNPEIARLLDDTDRFVASVDRLVRLISGLPDERLMLVDQFMDRVAAEREAMLRDLSETEPELRAVLTDLQPALQSLERIIELSKEKNPDSKPFDVNEYRALVEQSAVTAAELKLLVQSVNELIARANDAQPLIDALVDAENAVADRLVLQLAALVVFFFICLLLYRLIARRFTE